MTEASEMDPKKLVFVVLEENFYAIRYDCGLVTYLSEEGGYYRSIKEWADGAPVKHTPTIERNTEELIRQHGQGVLHGTLVIQQLLKDLGTETEHVEILALDVVLCDESLMKVIKQIHEVAAQLKQSHNFIVTLCHAYHGGRHDGDEEIDQELNKLAGGDNVMVFAAAGNNGKVPAHQMCEVSSTSVVVPPRVYLPALGLYHSHHNDVTVEVHWTSQADGMLICQARQRAAYGVPVGVRFSEMEVQKESGSVASGLLVTPNNLSPGRKGYSTVRWRPNSADAARNGVDISLLWDPSEKSSSEIVTVHMWVWSVFSKIDQPDPPEPLAHHCAVDRARFQASSSMPFNKYQLGKVAAAHGVVSVGCKTRADSGSDAGFLQTHTGPLAWQSHERGNMQPDVFTDGTHYLLEPEFAASSWAVVHMAAAVGKAWLRNPTMTGPRFIESERNKWQSFNDGQLYKYWPISKAAQ